MSERLVTTTQERLEELVADQRAAGHMRLPTEVELSQQLGVSRATVREALGLLESRGLIERKRGRGTTIRTEDVTVHYPVSRITPFSGFLERSGVPYELVEFNVRRTRVDEGLASALALDTDECYEVSRVYSVRGEQAAFLQHVLPQRIGDTRVPIERLHSDIVPFLENDCGLTLQRVQIALTAENSSEALAGRVEVTPGAALLVMYTKLVEVRGEPVALGAMAFRPDIVSVGVEAMEQLTPKREDSLPMGWLTG